MCRIMYASEYEVGIVIVLGSYSGKEVLTLWLVWCSMRVVFVCLQCLDLFENIECTIISIQAEYLFLLENSRQTGSKMMKRASALVLSRLYYYQAMILVPTVGGSCLT